MELTPTIQAALLATIGVVLVALITAIPTVTAIFVTDRRAAKRDEAAAQIVAAKVEEVATAAKVVAEQVEGVASKTEEVAAHLKESDACTTVKLDDLKQTTNQIHTLVNDNLSQQYKEKLILALRLARLRPDDPEIKAIVAQAQSDVDAHRPAESTTREEDGRKA